MRESMPFIYIKNVSNSKFAIFAKLELLNNSSI
jgi:hypothetical protein